MKNQSINKEKYFKDLNDSVNNKKYNYVLTYDEIIFTHKNSDWLFKHLNPCAIRERFKLDSIKESKISVDNIFNCMIIEVNRYNEIKLLIKDKKDRDFFCSLFKPFFINEYMRLYVGNNKTNEEDNKIKINALKRILKENNICNLIRYYFSYIYYMNKTYIQYHSNNGIKVVLNDMYTEFDAPPLKQVENILMGLKYTLFKTKKRYIPYKDSTLKRQIRRCLTPNKFELSYYFSDPFSGIIQEQQIALSRKYEILNYNDENNSFYYNKNGDDTAVSYDVNEKEGIDSDYKMFKIELRFKKSQINYIRNFSACRNFLSKSVSVLYKNTKFKNYIRKKLKNIIFNLYNKNTLKSLSNLIATNKITINTDNKEQMIEFISNYLVNYEIIKKSLCYFHNKLKKHTNTKIICNRYYNKVSLKTPVFNPCNILSLSENSYRYNQNKTILLNAKFMRNYSLLKMIRYNRFNNLEKSSSIMRL